MRNFKPLNSSKGSAYCIFRVSQSNAIRATHYEAGELFVWNSLRQFFLITLILTVGSLSACGASPTPEPEVVAGEPAATATEALAPSPTPEPPTPTNLPLEPQSADVKSPIATPAAEPAITPTDNPDLDYTQVVFVQATQNSDGLWRFDTTVRHNDQGWEDYADAWQVVDLEGNVLAERILTHPHDNEQPFTRNQSNIEIPPETTKVIVRAKDNVEGFGGQVVLVDLTVNEGENFEVIRAE